MCLPLIALVFMFSSFALADAGHDAAPDAHAMVMTTTADAQPSAQLPNAVIGFVIGVAAGIILGRFIFKKS